MSAAGPGAQPSGGGFFEHHGAWAPDTRLFPALNFRAMALIISTVFLVPTALLAWDFLSAKAEAIEFSAKERAGVNHLYAALPLVKLGQRYRLPAVQAQAKAGATSELAEARKALDAHVAKLDVTDKARSAELGTAKALAALKTAADTAAAAAAGADKIFEAHTAYIDAVLALIGQATDGSNLSLDPDMDTYNLMDGALGAVPILVESIAKPRGTTAAVAAQVASHNSPSAARGEEVIKDVVSTMQEINASSKKISDIIGTIDGIAFQTNILAQRSAQAAREIKTLITTRVEKVEAGTIIVKGAGETMQEPVVNAKRMNDLLAEVSTAASEQSNGVAQVGTAVNDLDRMARQHAARVEQTAAAASALKDQAMGLAGEA